MKQEASQTVRFGAASQHPSQSPQAVCHMGQKAPFTDSACLGARHPFTGSLRSGDRQLPHPRKRPLGPQAASGPPVWTTGAGPACAGPGETVYLPPDGAAPGPPAPAVSLRQRSKPVSSADSRDHGPWIHAIFLSLALPSYSDTSKLTLSHTHKHINSYTNT